MSQCLVEDSNDLVIHTILELPWRKLGNGGKSVGENPFAVVDCIWVCDRLKDRIRHVRVCDGRAALEGALYVVCNGVKEGVRANTRRSRLLPCREGFVVISAIWSER